MDLIAVLRTFLTRAVTEFLTEVVRADPAMSNHGASFSTGAAFDASGGRATY